MFNIENLYLLPFLLAPIKILIIYFVIKLLKTTSILPTLLISILLNTILTVGLLVVFGVNTVDDLLIKALISDTFKNVIFYFIVYYALINTTIHIILRNALRIIIVLILIVSSYIVIKSYSDIKDNTVVVRLNPNPQLKGNRYFTMLYLKNSSNTKATVAIRLDNKKVTLSSRPKIILKANEIKKSFLKLNVNKEFIGAQKIAITFTIDDKHKIIRYIKIPK